MFFIAQGGGPYSPKEARPGRIAAANHAVTSSNTSSSPPQMFPLVRN